MRPLETDVQSAFGAGAYPLVARDAIPPNAVEDAVNALITDQSLLRRRGGSTQKTSPSLPGVRFFYDGYLGGGLRTLWIGSDQLLRVLDIDDATPMLALAASPVYPYLPTKAAVIAGMLVLPSGVLYGGARHFNTYTSQASVAVTQGSAAVVGTGTSFTTQGTAGTLFQITGSGHQYVIESITDNTHLTLSETFKEATASGQNYDLRPTSQVSQVAGIYAAVANKLVACVGGRAYMSALGKPQTWPADEYHQLPTGAVITGAEALRDTLVLFSTQGVWAAYNVALDLTDAQGNAQQRLEQINRDIILWSWPGVATYHGQLVVPALDDVWLMDATSAPQRITGGMAALYRSYVAAGYHSGNAAVYQGRYFLPILDSAQNVIDLLVCRLDPTSRGEHFGWTRFAGDGANLTALSARVASAVSRNPALLGGHQSNGRIYTLDYFGSTATDADGSAHVATITTREFRLQGAVRRFLQRIRVRYELAGSGATLAASQSTDGAGAAALTGTAAVATISAPKIWQVRKRGYGVRFVFTTAGAATSFVLHSVEAWIRQSSRS